ncbi:MAG TPA: GlsB/YeaQ/YmgE family stress response membrane protein [Isosphaeraceae bacterium]|nr:GlsB/YeaQ/YmgE family stress response membrane protein [Isosphaeraceae bacterium]
MHIILFLLIGIAAGWLAGQLVKGRGFGLVENLIIGVIGALIGGFVFGALNVNVGGLLGQLIAATVGAIILLYLLKLLRRHSW